MELAQSLFCCFPSSNASESISPSSQHMMERSSSKEPPLSPKASANDTEQLSINVVDCLRSADHKHHLERELGDIVRAAGWSEMLAKNVLAALEKALRDGREKMGPAMRDAYDHAVRAADVEFRRLAQEVKEHPTEIACAVLLTLVALGVLAVLAPYILELLGFGELGPVAGTFASWWESTYGGYIPAGSLFSFFQRLGMIWSHV